MAVATAEDISKLCDRISRADACIAELEAALRDLLRATSNSVVMKPSDRHAWLRAEAVLLRVPMHPPRP